VVTGFCESSAITVIEYVPAVVKEWDAVAEVPPGAGKVHSDSAPSPQSNWYWIESPLAVVVEAVKVQLESGSPQEGPLGAAGLAGGAALLCGGTTDQEGPGPKQELRPRSARAVERTSNLHLRCERIRRHGPVSLDRCRALRP
jgi:hypothetical protein